MTGIPIPAAVSGDGPRFHAVYVAGKGPFRYAVLDSWGVVRGLFRGRHPAEHAARMLALGAGYDPQAVLGTRVLPLSAPPSRRVRFPVVLSPSRLRRRGLTRSRPVRCGGCRDMSGWEVGSVSGRCLLYPRGPGRTRPRCVELPGVLGGRLRALDARATRGRSPTSTAAAWTATCAGT